MPKVRRPKPPERLVVTSAGKSVRTTAPPQPDEVRIARNRLRAAREMGTGNEQTAAEQDLLAAINRAKRRKRARKL